MVFRVEIPIKGSQNENGCSWVITVNYIESSLEFSIPTLGVAHPTLHSMSWLTKAQGCWCSRMSFAMNFLV